MSVVRGDGVDDPRHGALRGVSWFYAGEKDDSSEGVPQRVSRREEIPPSNRVFHKMKLVHYSVDVVFVLHDVVRVAIVVEHDVVSVA